ncbi:MAG: GntR family transcriptional regulator [Candidatus Methylomirabilota bacterium]|jgi:DNA-binding FadR family transcriptional regulator
MANLAKVSVIQKRRPFENVAKHLWHLIPDRNLKDGGRPPHEVNLVERFGVGRPSVREVPKMLNQIGLVKTRWGEKAVAQTTHQRKASVE